MTEGGAQWLWLGGACLDQGQAQHGWEQQQ
jgi:hypothetical protein